MDAPVGNVDFDGVAGLHQADGAAFRRFRGGMADGQAGGAAGEAPVGKQGAFLAQAPGLQVAGGIEHFLHARAALGAFVADHHHVSGHHFIAQNAFHCRFLAFVNPRLAGEFENGFIHSGGFHDTAVFRQIAVEHGQAAILGIGVFQVTHAAVGAVQIQFRKAPILGEGHLGGYPTGGRLIELQDFPGSGTGHVIGVDGFAQGFQMHRARFPVDQPGPVQLGQNAHDAAGPMHVFHVIFLGSGGHLAEAGHLAGKPVDVLHGEIDPGFLSHGQEVEHRIGGTAHGHIQAHGVFKGIEAGNAAGQNGGVVLFVPALGQFHDAPPGPQEQFLAVRMGGHHRAVAGQGQAQGFGQAVHGIGGKHAGTGTAGGAGGAFELFHFPVGNLGIPGLDHGVDQIHRHGLAFPLDLTRFHGAAGDEDGGDIHPHGRHQHPRGDFVAIGNAHHGISTVGIHHVFHGIGNEVPGRQAVEHAVMAHGDAVVDGDGVEFLGNAPRRLDFPGHQLAQILKMDVAGHELGEGIHHGNDGFAEIAVLHAGGTPQGAGAGHVAAVGGCMGTIGRHGISPDDKTPQ